MHQNDAGNKHLSDRQIIKNKTCMEIRKALEEAGLKNISIIWLVGGFPFILLYLVFYSIFKSKPKQEQE